MLHARLILACALVLAATAARALEERIRGTLEPTAKPGACAQIVDALNETYYVRKTPAAEKLCEPLLGKRVVLTGTVEQAAGEQVYFLVVSRAEPYQPKAPPPKTNEPPEGKGTTPRGTGPVQKKGEGD